MPALDHLLAFAAATFAFAIFPGPALLFTAAQTLARGRRVGLLAVLGIHAGCYVHVLLATLGITAVLAAVPALYALLKFSGACYLVWLGIQFFLAGAEAGAAAPRAQAGLRRIFADSFLVEIFNPKVALFFAAFLPQFADPAAVFPVWLQMLILGIVVNFSFSAADVATVFAAGFVQATAGRNKTVRRAIRAACGSLLIGLGVKLAFEKA